jgi:hypothetical protein
MKIAGSLVLSVVSLWITDQASAQQCVPSDAPLVIWVVSASSGQSGWGGLSNPTVNRFPPYTYESLPPGAPLRVVDSWSANWSYSLGTQPSTGYLRVSFDGASFTSEHLVTANWNGQFLIESVWANITLQAWVRGPIGTAVEVLEAYVGGGNAARLNYTGGAMGGGLSSAFPGATGSSFAHSTTAGCPNMCQTSTATRTFVQYPGVTYSLLSFSPIQATMSAAQSCIMACPGSFVNGTTYMQSFVNIRLPAGIPPKVLAIFPLPENANGDYAVASDSQGVFVPHSTGIELRALAYDPDDGNVIGAGITGYRWTVEGAPFGPGLGAWCTGDTVVANLAPGATQVWTVSAVDNEGDVSPPKTIRLRSQPVFPLPWPGSSQPPRPIPVLSATGGLGDGSFAVMLHDAAPSVHGLLVLGSPGPAVPLLGGALYSTAQVLLPLTTDSAGEWVLSDVPALPGLAPLLLQAWTWSGSGMDWASSNGFLSL